MEQENKDGFDQEETNETEQTESISEFIHNQNYVHIEPFQAIPDKEMVRYQNDVFWYVYDEAAQEILAHLTNNVERPAVYLFQEQEDAVTWKDIGSISGTHQDKKLVVLGEVYLPLKKDIDDYKQLEAKPINHTEAQKLFANYPEALLTLEVRKNRKLNGDSEEDE